MALLTAKLPTTSHGKHAVDNKERLSAVSKYRIWNTPQEEALNLLTQIMANNFEVPMAALTFVGQHQVFHKATVGLGDLIYVENNLSICPIAIQSENVTVFSAMQHNPLFADNELIQKTFGVRFYAAAPITTPEGYRLGTACIADTNDRTFTKQEQDQLVNFARLAMHELETRLTIIKNTEVLKKQHKERQNRVTDAIVKAQERERSTIASELHDNVNQILTTVKLYNEMAIDRLSDPKVLLKKSNSFIQVCIDEIRSLSKRLSSPTLGNTTLDQTVSELANAINFTKKVEIDCKITGTDFERINNDLHLCAYRIIQELLNNVLKHADADRVTVRVALENKLLCLMVADNGKGFSITEKKSGIGLTNIKARVDSWNGVLSVNSAPGQGCSTLVSFPLRNVSE